MAQAKHDSITRRALLSGVAAVVPAAAIAGVPPLAPPDFADAPSGLPPAVTTEPDPIFAAIEAHARLRGTRSARPRAGRGRAGGMACAARATARCQSALEGGVGDARALLRPARRGDRRFVATVPHSMEGAAAALAYVRMHYAKGYPVCEEEEAVTLMASTETAIRRAAGLPLPAEARHAARRAVLEAREV